MACCALPLPQHPAVTEGAEAMSWDKDAGGNFPRGASGLSPTGAQPQASGPQRHSWPPRQETTPQQPRPHRATLRGFCLLPAPCPRCPPGPAAIPSPSPPSICVPRSTMPPRVWCWPWPCPPTCSRWLPWRSLGTPGTQDHQEEEEEAGRGRGSPHSHHASTTTAAAAASAAVRTGAEQCLWPGPASQWGVGTSQPSTASPRGVVTLQPSRCHGAALGPHGPRSITERCCDLTAWHSVTAEFRRNSAVQLTLFAHRFSSKTLVLPDFQW